MTADQKNLLAKQLLSLRKQRKLSMQKLAEAVGVSAAYICRLEAGERHPSRELLVKLSQVLMPYPGTHKDKDELLIAAGFAPSNYRNFMGRQDVLSLYEQAVAENPDDFKAYIALVISHIRVTHYERAEELIQSGMQHFDDMVQLQALMAALELARQDFDRAIQFQSEAIHHFQLAEAQNTQLRLADLLLSLGVMHFEKGHQQAYDAQVALSRKEIQAATQVTQQALQSLAAAKKAFTQALAAEPEDIYILDELARVNFTVAYLLEPEQAASHWLASIEAFEKSVCSPDKEALGYDALLQSTAFLALAYSKASQFQQAWFTINVVESCLPNYWLIHYIKACYFGLRFQHEMGGKRLSQPGKLLLQSSLKALTKAVQISEDKPKTLIEAKLEPDLRAVRQHCRVEFESLLSQWGVEI